MNMKYYLRGLGIGLIITTLILTISHHINNPQEDEENTQPQATTGSVIAYTKEDKTKEEENTTQSTQSTTQQIQQTENDDDNTEITIDIQGVYYGTDVSDLLYDAGVITDKQEFSDYLKENGYDTIIREGSYTFTKGDTYENLAKIITRS